MAAALPTNKQLRGLAEHKSGSKLPSERHILNRLYHQVTGDAGDNAWAVAFAHISLHFSDPPQELDKKTGELKPSKPKHNKFHKKYRTADAVRGLIAQAVSRPSQATFSLLKENGMHVGAPCLEVKRTFGFQIGTGPEQCTLVVVGDLNGRLVTAFPDG